MIELREIEEWQRRRCNSCLNENNVKEISCGMVIAICEDCRLKLKEML